jgi:23S rRNA (pseudouridine1915-N3)-methyltransferase
MNITIFTIGKVKNSFLQKEIQNLQQRIPRLEIISLKECKANVDEEVKKKEYLSFKSYLEKQGVHILLTEKGKQYTTYEFYNKLKSFEQPIYFYISGALGPHDLLKQEISNHLSLSKMIFTHEQALYLLVEQLYRCNCFEKNIPYTK